MVIRQNEISDLLKGKRDNFDMTMSLKKMTK